MKVEVSRHRRIVVLDIETVSLDPSNEKGALDALTGQIVCIGLLFASGNEITEVALVGEDERRLLSEFWETVKPTDVLVGHNLLDFDLMFIRQRSCIHGIKPSRSIDLRRFYTEDVVDTMLLWTNWGFKKGVKLDALGGALGCGVKTGHGGDVAQWWSARELKSIASYCMEDVRLTYRVFCRLTYQPMQLVATPRMVASNVNSDPAGGAADTEHQESYLETAPSALPGHSADCEGSPDDACSRR